MHEARLCASAYAREGEIVLVPVSGATGLVIPAVTRVPASSSPRELGLAVLATLQASTAEPTAAPDASQNAALVAKSAGFASWKALEKSARCVAIEADGGRIQLVPMRRSRGGFVANRGDPVHAVSSGDASEIGERLRESIEQAVA